METDAFGVGRWFVGSSGVDSGQIINPRARLQERISQRRQASERGSRGMESWAANQREFPWLVESPMSLDRAKKSGKTVVQHFSGGPS
jgi:hypothetical protein